MEDSVDLVSGGIQARGNSSGKKLHKCYGFARWRFAVDLLREQSNGKAQSRTAKAWFGVQCNGMAMFGTVMIGEGIVSKGQERQRHSTK